MVPNGTGSALTEDGSEPSGAATWTLIGIIACVCLLGIAVAFTWSSRLLRKKQLITTKSVTASFSSLTSPGMESTTSEHSLAPQIRQRHWLAGIEGEMAASDEYLERSPDVPEVAPPDECIEVARQLDLESTTATLNRERPGAPAVAMVLFDADPDTPNAIALSPSAVEVAQRPGAAHPRVVDRV